MVRFQMRFKAEMEGVGRLVLEKDARINLDCQHPSSSEAYPNLWVMQEEELEIPNSRGTCNLVVKVGDKRHGTLKFENFAKDFEYTEEQSGTFVPVCEFECRDLEPTKWIIDSSDWIAFGKEDRTKFDEVKFEDGAWFDYDENEECEVSVQELAFEFKRVK
eukprot:TRINITY_DN16675_c0_g1_i1.p1 TRINITY_DN16675_c0_g1~~TRINITY_DN16675_c0_g1_i1.p1  ORF type:complete len:181 (+),score=98.78 TRINITY_DN16675_c0_g1_i1:62-544(+)